jgi:hypothetical protein
MIHAAVELPDFVTDEPLRIGMRACVGCCRLNARDLSVRHDHIQRAGVRAVHRASGANGLGHSTVLEDIVASCTSICASQKWVSLAPAYRVYALPLEILGTQ